ERGDRVRPTRHVHPLDETIRREIAGHDDARVVARLVRRRDRRIVVRDAELVVLYESVRLDPLHEPLPELRDPAGAEGADVAHVGDVIAGLLLHADSHGDLLPPTMPARAAACFAAFAELFARLALKAAAPSVRAARAPRGGAHAEPRAERAREGRGRGEAVIERDLQHAGLTTAEQRRGPPREADPLDEAEHRFAGHR